MSGKSISVAVVGASGYGGGELLRLLANHPDLKLQTVVSNTYAGQPVTSAWPNLPMLKHLHFAEKGDTASECEAVFLAQENGKAMLCAPALLEAGCKVVDLSADFRFRSPSKYGEWYSKHAAPTLTESAVYGLPELYRDRIKSSQLVGNPGCYATAAILALAPLLKAGVAETSSIIVDGKSGVSGAGRASFSLDYHYSEVEGSVSAYKVAGTHRHTPEIEAALEDISGQHGLVISFTPHLIPMTRGILATSYVTLNGSMRLTEVWDLYEEMYADAPFVVLSKERLPSTKQTAGSNYCYIGLALDTRANRLTVISTIDNLNKGAAGQAIQNMNLMCGLEETAGLMDGGVWP